MMMNVQMRKGSVPQLQSSFVAGKPLAVTPARSGRLVSQRFSGTPQAIFGNKQKQPSLTKVIAQALHALPCALQTDMSVRSGFICIDDLCIYRSKRPAGLCF